MRSILRADYVLCAAVRIRRMIIIVVISAIPAQVTFAHLSEGIW